VAEVGLERLIQRIAVGLAVAERVDLFPGETWTADARANFK
jgi:hypothetical protein